MTRHKLRDRIPVESEAGEDPSTDPSPCPTRPTHHPMIRVEHAARPDRPDHHSEVWTLETVGASRLSTLSIPSTPIFLI